MLNSHKLSGINYEVETVKDGIATINMMVDFTKVDSDGMEALEKIGYVDTKDKKYTLEETIKLFETNVGITCKEK